MTTTIPRKSVGFSELLDHAQQESHRWHDWFNQHSQALDVPIDIAGSATVRDLLSHIVFVDLLFAEWLLGESTTLAAKSIQPDSPTALTRPPPMPFSPSQTLRSWHGEKFSKRRTTKNGTRSCRFPRPRKT